MKAGLFFCAKREAGGLYWKTMARSPLLQARKGHLGRGNEHEQQERQGQQKEEVRTGSLRTQNRHETGSTTARSVAHNAAAAASRPHRWSSRSRLEQKLRSSVPLLKLAIATPPSPDAVPWPVPAPFASAAAEPQTAACAGKSAAARLSRPAEIFAGEAV